MVAEAQLMRTCGPLYGSFALESLWTLILAAFFAYLSVLISSKQQIKSPCKAICKFMCHNFDLWASDTWRILSRWDTMHECDMGQRFRFCRRLNATICRVQVATALLAVTRWLHFNNVNGFRYLGYAFTCPLMQAELILLIAPAVPCYKLNIAFTMALTFAMLVSGWYVSNLEGDLWTTSMRDIVVDHNFQNLTEKGKLIFPSMAIVIFLSFVQIPYLMFLYNVNGRPDNMPGGFNKMLLLTGVTWLGFPTWWMLSFEGTSIISDTKLNGAGFMLLNVISKGGFTLCMIGMVKEFKRKNLAKPQQRERSGSVASVESLPPLPGDAPEPVQRKERQLPTGQSLVWMINAVKSFDVDEYGEPVQVGTPGQQGAQQGQSGEKVTDARQLTNTELANELLRRFEMPQAERDRLSSGGGLVLPGLAKGRTDDPQKQQSFDAQLANACMRFVEEDSDKE